MIIRRKGRRIYIRRIRKWGLFVSGKYVSPYGQLCREVLIGPVLIVIFYH